MDVQDIKTTIDMSKELAPTSELISGLLGSVCHKDKAMYSRLIEDPRAEINRMSSYENLKYDDSFNIQTVQNTEDVVYVPLPQYEMLETMKLSDEQMQNISGGEIFVALGTAIVTATIGAIYTVAWATSTLAIVGVLATVAAVAATVAVAGAVGTTAYVGIAAGSGAI